MKKLSELIRIVECDLVLEGEIFLVSPPPRRVRPYTIEEVEAYIEENPGCCAKITGIKEDA